MLDKSQKKKLYISIIGFIGLLAFSVGISSYAWVTDSVVSNGKIQVGTFKLSFGGYNDSLDNTVLFNTGNMEPGVTSNEKTISFINTGTFAWFTDYKTAKVSASVMDEAKLINIDIECDSDNNGVSEWYRIIPRQDNILVKIINPKSIKVTRMDKSTRPVIYFDVNGELANFILHVHPVDFLDKNKNPINIEIVNVIPNCNMGQDNTLYGTGGNNKENFTTGVLSIRYLNGFISQDINVSFKNSVILENYYKLSKDNR